eukprot:2096713-Prymnesium_polylepis.1
MPSLPLHSGQAGGPHAKLRRRRQTLSKMRRSGPAPALRALLRQLQLQSFRTSEPQLLSSTHRRQWERSDCVASVRDDSGR